MNIPCNQPTDINDNQPQPVRVRVEPELLTITNRQRDAIELALAQLKAGQPQFAMRTLEEAKL